MNVLRLFSNGRQTSGTGFKEESPYKTSPAALGFFAARSPNRPNPLALTCVGMTGLDFDAGIISLDWIGADDGSPVLDLKPYTPQPGPGGKTAGAPLVFSHWPQSREASAAFDWAAEFNFSL